MFSYAYGIVKNFTRPVIISTRLASGQVRCGLATFIVVNKEGWIVTAAHVLNCMQLSGKHLQEKADFDRAVQAIRSDTSLSTKTRNRKLELVRPNPEWIINQSLWWCQDGATAQTFNVDADADIAIAKLENFDTSGISSFPVFKPAQADPPPGGSLCRLGFPFVQLSALFDEAANRFVMQNFTLPPMFPNDGIHTRMMILVNPSTNRSVKFIETSTPGLMGQSGGPLFDPKGEIWGIQSRTNFLELGFSPKKKEGSREIIEHQFMNVGLASHVQHTVDLLQQQGVKHESA